MIETRKNSHKNSQSQMLRWIAALSILLLLVIYEILIRTRLITLAEGYWLTLDRVIIVLIGGLAYFLIAQSLRWRDERRSLEMELAQLHGQVVEANRRQQSVFQMSQLYNQTNSEDEVIELTLRFSRELVGAKGASFVPLDERSHALPPVSTGDIPPTVSEDWLQYLASPAVRDSCSTCRTIGHSTPECPLLDVQTSGAKGMFCLPFARGDQEYGILNLYLSEMKQFDADTQDFLRKIVSEATLALEGIRLRKRELETLRDLQTVRERTDLDSLLSNLLYNLNDSLESDFSQLWILNETPGQSASSVMAGELPTNARPLVEGILQSVMASYQPVVFGDVSGDLRSSPGIRSLMAVPLLLPNDSSLGAIVVASQRLKAFTQRQLTMLQTVSSQAALVVQNVNLMAELEYKTMIEERSRLAREIHDGLAQTLGFLKLKMAQMQNYSDQGDYDRLNETIPVCYDTLADAYQEVRQAIDGLRVTSGGTGLDDWLRQTVREFQDNSGLEVHICDPIDDANLPPEVHIQLIRIVQEALNNIRKHAHGQHAWVSCQKIEGDLILEVRDDGAGFDIEDIPGPSQHGLRGMRERSELIGADFQMISLPGQGTIVRLRLPLSIVGDSL